MPALLAAEVHFTEQLEPARVAELVRRERISVLVAVPRVLHLLRVHLLGRFPELETPPIGQKRAMNGAPAEDDGGGGVKGVLRKWWHEARTQRAGLEVLGSDLGRRDNAG